MNNILEKNLNSLPELKEIYLQYQNNLYPVEYSKNSEPTFKINNIYQHSKYDPVREAEKIVDLLIEEKNELDAFIIYGSGLGYVARSLFEKLIKNSISSIFPFIIYIEKDIKIFLTSLQFFDWSEIISSQNFKFFIDTGKETIGSFVQTIPTKRIRYYYHRPGLKFNEDYYREVQNYIEYVLDRKDMNIATFTRFQKLWTKNFIYNLPYYFQTKSLKQLSGIGKKTTAVLVAGGPTLDVNVEYLKKVGESAIIIAVDTVYKFLKKHKVNVDILVTVDPQFWNYKYVENEKISDAIIVAESSTYPKIFQLAPIKNYFVGSSIFPIVDYFDKENKNRGILAAGGSVATSAFDIARLINAENIICIGLDLSFPGRMTHFKGSYFEKNFLNFTGYFNPAEMASYNYLVHTPLRLIDATSNKVFSDQKMFLFKKWFDREIPLTDAKVFLPDSGGAYLEGAKIVKIEDMPLGDISSKKEFLSKVFELKNKIINPDYETLNGKINLIIKYNKKIKKTSEDIVKLISAEGQVDIKDQKIIEKLEESLFSEENIAQITRVISSSAQDILLSIMENVEYDKNEKKSAWIKTRLLHESIIKLSTFYSECFNKL